jgi:DNA ligase (NAD+)
MMKTQNKSNNSEIERIYELRSVIEYHNDLYYNQDAPEISDAAYDALVEELIALENKCPETKSNSSPSENVGGKSQSTFDKVTHQVPLLSLRDVFDCKEVSNFLETVEPNKSNHTDTLQAAFVVEEKVDGLSMAITYKNGIFTNAATRGDGRIGEDVTENARQIESIPKEIPFLNNSDNTLIVRAEVIMPVTEFEKLNQKLESMGKPLSKNPRNAAAGSLRTKDPQITKERNLDAIAFDVLYFDGELTETQFSHIEFLEKIGFKTVECIPCYTSQDIFNSLEYIGEKRSDSPFWIDGAVIKCNYLDVQKDLGTTNKYPKWAVAYKYPPEKKLTIIRDIITQTGRTGVITPVAVFDPVLLAGTSVSRATLHNQQFIDTNLGGIAIGDTVEVHKSGEIIPEILQVIKEKRPADAKLFKIETCPICGSPAVQEKDENGNVSPAHTCSNENCPAKLEKHIIYWASKNIMNIDGFGSAATQVLIQNNLLNSIPDIYRLTYSDVIGLSTQNSSVFGIAKARKLILAIEKSKSNNIDRLIAGLGIANVGRTIGAALAKKIKLYRFYP